MFSWCTHYPRASEITKPGFRSTEVNTEDGPCRDLPVLSVRARLDTEPSHQTWPAPAPRSPTRTHEHLQAHRSTPDHHPLPLFPGSHRMRLLRTHPAHVSRGEGWRGHRLPLQEPWFSSSRHEQRDGKLIHRWCTVRHRRDIYLFLITNNVLH